MPNILAEPKIIEEIGLFWDSRGIESGAFTRGEWCTYGIEQKSGVTGRHLRFDASKTLDSNGKTIDNPAYKDPMNGVPVEVKSRNFTYKNWIRIF